MDVANYGLHWDGPIAWLVQGRASSNFIGAAKRCPFDVSSGECNHMIASAAPVPDARHWNRFVELLDDPLVQAMLPLPKLVGQKSFFISDRSDTLSIYLSCLSRLSSPIQSVVRPFWMMDKKDVEKQMNRSNIQPWVITSASSKNQTRITELLQAADLFPRTLIITGSDDLVLQKTTQRIKTKIQDVPLQDLLTLPLESIGAAVIRKYARKEPLV